MDRDNEIGYWLNGVPYVWFQDNNWGRYHRFYMANANDWVYVPTGPMEKFDWSRQMKMRDIQEKEPHLYRIIPLPGCKSEKALDLFRAWNPYATSYRVRDILEFDIRINGKRQVVTDMFPNLGVDLDGRRWLIPQKRIENDPHILTPDGRLIDYMY